jgi:hypothetical protein
MGLASCGEDLGNASILLGRSVKKLVVHELTVVVVSEIDGDLLKISVKANQPRSLYHTYVYPAQPSRSIVRQI